MTEEKWLYWCDTVHDPYFNMSMDEVLLSNSALQENRVLVRIYRWDRPSVSFGSAQICPQELADKYTLVRRPTGGGVVYHDVDLTYTAPGRLGNYTDENEEETAAPAAKNTGSGSQAERIIALLGGRENIVLVDACMTRLRVTVKDAAKVADLAAWKAEGALSLLVKGDGIQAVYGPKADVLKSDINDIL